MNNTLSMKKLYFPFLIVSILFFYACEEEIIIDNGGIEIVHENRFSRPIPNCQVGGNTEMNCVEFIEFLNDSEADLLLGGNDILERGEYTIVDNQISVVINRQNSYSINFEIIDSLQIMRIEDNTIWTKD